MTLQLRNSPTNLDGDPRGYRYTVVDRDATYLCWLSVGRRSFAVTSERTGIAENTLRAWARADGWPGRARVHDAETAESGRVAVLAAITSELAASVQTIVELRDDRAAPAKVRLEAALALLGIGGIAPVKHVALKPAVPDPFPAHESSSAVSFSAEQETLEARLAARLASSPDEVPALPPGPPPFAGPESEKSGK